LHREGRGKEEKEETGCEWRKEGRGGMVKPDKK